MLEEGLTLKLNKATLFTIVSGVLGLVGSSGTLGTLLHQSSSDVTQIQQAIPSMVRGAEVCRVELNLTRELLIGARESTAVCREASMKLLDRCVP